MKRLPVIIVDTREQRPWPLLGRPKRKRALKFGDYALAGREALFAVERKSVPDFASSMHSGRLQEQHAKAAAAGCRLVTIVEGTLARCSDELQDYAPVSAASFNSIVAAAIVQGMPPPLFAGSAWEAERLAVCLLLMEVGSNGR